MRNLSFLFFIIPFSLLMFSCSKEKEVDNESEFVKYVEIQSIDDQLFINGFSGSMWTLSLCIPISETGYASYDASSDSDALLSDYIRYFRPSLDGYADAYKFKYEDTFLHSKMNYLVVDGVLTVTSEGCSWHLTVAEYSETQIFLVYKDECGSFLILLKQVDSSMASYIENLSIEETEYGKSKIKLTATTYGITRDNTYSNISAPIPITISAIGDINCHTVEYSSYKADSDGFVRSSWFSMFRLDEYSEQLSCIPSKSDHILRCLVSPTENDTEYAPTILTLYYYH